MHLFLIRHGETEHNIAGLLAGVTDSQLTNHGVLQAERLGNYLVNEGKLNFTHVFASDLRRAYITAGKICEAQNKSESGPNKIEAVRLSLLQEQNFGSFELVPWTSAREFIDKRPDRSDTGFVPKETDEAMSTRADQFLNDYIVPLIAIDDVEESRVAVVSHGLFLGTLWRALLARFRPGSVSVTPSVILPRPDQSLAYQTAWTNTGYLELRIARADNASDSTPTSEMETTLEQSKQSLILPVTVSIETINGKDHLLNLKRTRGGVGSATHDERQKRLESFFKTPANAEG